jgi:iron(III) transport system substrate-binding protein
MKVMPKNFKRAWSVLLLAGLLSGFMSRPGLAVTQAAAEQDGKVVWYVAMLPTEARDVADKFMAEYPKIHVTYVVMRANQIPIRLTTEMRAGEANADVVSSSAWDVSALALAHDLLKYQPPEAKNLIPAAVDKNGYWVGEFLLTLPIAYNTKVLTSEGLPPPKSLADLTKPEYKGKFSIEIDDYEWFHALVDALGQPMMDKLAANGPLFRDGHTTNMNGVIDGEFPISLGVFGYKAYAAEQQGFPIVILNAPPTVAEFQIVGIPENAPHMNAAKFFENWLISKDAQNFVENKFQRTPTRNDVPPLTGIYDPTKVALTYSDPNAAAQYSSYENGFNRTFHINGQ